MTPASRTALRNDIKPAEGFRQFPYFDCCGKPYRQCTCAVRGKLTIGYGRNLDDVGLSELEGEVLLDHDVYTAETSAAKAFDWFSPLSELRQRAITELVFNMGLAKFREFTNTIAEIRAGRYAAAAERLLESRWKVQVGPTRSGRIASYLKDGG